MRPTPPPAGQATSTPFPVTFIIAALPLLNALKTSVLAITSRTMPRTDVAVTVSGKISLKSLNPASLFHRKWYPVASVHTLYGVLHHNPAPGPWPGSRC